MSITDGNSAGYFAVDSGGNVTVADLILVDAAEVYSLTIEVSGPCGSYETALDVSVLPVVVNVFPADEDGSFAFQFDHYGGSDTSLDSYWILPATFVIEVILPDVASPSDYQIELWNGSTMGLVSTENTFYVDVIPTVLGGAINLWADVLLAADPTVQVAGDSEDASFSQFQKQINGQVVSWIGDLAQSGFRSALKSQIDDPFEAVKDHITNVVLPQLDPTQQSAMIDFRDNQLPSLHDQMVDKVISLVFDQVLHTGKATVRNGSAALDGLQSLGGIDVSTAPDKMFEIQPVINFALDDEIKDALLALDFATMVNRLDKPHKLFSEVGLGARYYWDTETYAAGRLTVSNLDSDLKKSTYKARIDVFNINWGVYYIDSGLSSEWTPETNTAVPGVFLDMRW